MTEPLVEQLRQIAECSRNEADVFEQAATALAAAETAMREIAEGRGRFSIDQYQHACNTIEDMKQLANDWLSTYGTRSDD